MGFDEWNRWNVEGHVEGCVRRLERSAVSEVKGLLLLSSCKPNRSLDPNF